MTEEGKVCQHALFACRYYLYHFFFFDTHVSTLYTATHFAHFPFTVYHGDRPTRADAGLSQTFSHGVNVINPYFTWWKGKGSSLGSLLIKGLLPSTGPHPHDLITSQSLHLLMPSPQGLGFKMWIGESHKDAVCNNGLSPSDFRSRSHKDLKGDSLWMPLLGSGGAFASPLTPKWHLTV